jgi:16S rRNA (guanine527-N7)-methyltransferase
LAAWTQITNLTTIVEPQGILIKHFLDSLTCSLAIGITDDLTVKLHIVDVGSGAGFPTLPLKIIYPQLEVTLVDKVRKKCDFLRYIVDELRLDGVKILHERAETLGTDPNHRQSYDWAVARAVTKMPVLCEYLLPLVKMGGFCLAQKSENAIRETQEAAGALTILGGQIISLLPVHLPGIAATRYLVVIRKVQATPEKYPRRPGFPKKQPLL